MKIYSPAIRSGIIVIVEQGALSTAMFVAGVLVARSTSKEEYSVYVLCFSVLMILQGIQRALVNLPLTVNLPKLSLDKKQIYLGSTLVHSILFCIVTALFVMAIEAIALINNTTFQGNASLAGGIMFAFTAMLLREYLRNSLLAELRITQSAITSIIATCLMLLALTWYFLNNQLTVLNSFYIIGATSSLAALIMALRDPGKYKISISHIIPDFMVSIKLGKWILINAIAFIGVSQIYPWLALYLLNSEAVATFGVCLAIAGLMNPFIRGANAYILPRMSHSVDGTNESNVYRLLKKSVVILCVPYGFWLILGSVFSENLIDIFYGNSYTGFGSLVALLLLKNFIESISSPLTSALQAISQPHITTIGILIGTSITVIAGPPLIINYGLIGLGISAVMSSFAIALWKSYIVNTRMKTQI